MKPQIMSAQVRFLATLGLARESADGANHDTTVAIRSVKPIVETVLKPVHTVLLIPLAKPFQQCHTKVGFAVAIAIFSVKNLRGGTDDHSFAPRHNSIGKIQIGKKDCGLIVLAVVVGVLK